MNRTCANTLPWLVLGSALLLGASPLARAQELSFDFRDGHFNDQLFRYVGEKPTDHITRDAGGLRWRFLAGNAPKQPVGIHWRSSVAGDFVATAHYEILSNERPTKGAGVGFEVYLMLDNPAKDGVALARLLNPIEGPVITFNHMTNNEDGKRVVKAQKRITLPPDSPRGRLRLARTGAVLIASCAAGDNQDFEELIRAEIGPEDIRMIRMAGITGGDATAQLDMRLLSANLNANVPALQGKEVQPVHKNAAPAAIGGGGRDWTLWIAIPVGLGVLALVAALLLVIWLRRPSAKKDRDPEKPRQKSNDVDENTEAMVAFSCRECGKKLRARRTSVGKRIRCPGCGHSVQVPKSHEGIKA